jgi:hypothetical protein
VVTTGDTGVLPLKVTGPTSGVIVTVSASETLQNRVELCPTTVIVDGLAKKELIMGTAGSGPLHPVINTKTTTIQNKTKILL